MKRYFRGEKLIDREENIKFFIDWFKKIPKEILWIYGPKSSGKTTIIEYVVENELFEDFWKFKLKKDYWVKYVNLRGKLITSYETFLESFIKPKNSGKKKESLSARVNVGIFEINASVLNEVKSKKKDLFDVIIEEMIKIKANHKILIIDEIQTLEEIYINGDRELLKEFLNFCVRLTKELHLSHVVILSSNTIFIDRIYNDAKLKKTSTFYKIDHLDKDIVVEWLSEERFNKEEIELIWDYFGGCIFDIQRLIRDRKNINSLKEYLEKEAFSAYAQIVNLLIEEKDLSKRDKFKEIAKSIIEKGCFYMKEETESEIKEIVSFYSEKEILFFDPDTLKVTGNSRIYEKGMEKLVKGN